MRKAEEAAIRRARREIVRVRGLEEEGVLGDLVGAAGGVMEEKGRLMSGPMEGMMDESEDEGMLVDDEED